MLPSWPDGTVTVLATAGSSPHAIPVSAALRGGGETILIALGAGRESLARLRADPSVALVVLAEDDVALTAHGMARVLEDPMPEGVVAVLVEVDGVQDHRRKAFTIDAGVRFRWNDQAAQRRDAEVWEGLGRIAAGRRHG